MSLSGAFIHFRDRLLDLIYEFFNFLFGDRAGFFDFIELRKDTFLFITEGIHVLLEVLGRSEAFHVKRCRVIHHFKGGLAFCMKLNELFSDQLVPGGLGSRGWCFQELPEWRFNP